MRPAAAICRELTTDRRTDGELLVAFTTGPSEEAFAELVRRHGPLVWGACRRLLPEPSDAEDAFQAAFLVLVRRAHRLTHSSTLAPWLHQVAVWTARNVRRKNARRLARFSAIPEHLPASTAPDPDLKADLDAALLALPARYRDPILLCHLQGFTRREAAERLGCAEGTLSAWLNRGLAKLRTRLRGLDPTKVLSVATASVPTALSVSTAHAAVATVVAAASIPPTVSVLVEGVIHMLWMKKATAAAFLMCAVFTLGVGVGLSTRPGSSGAGAQDNPTKTPGTKSKETQDLADEAKALAAEYETLLAFDSKLRSATDQLVESLKKREGDPKLLVERLTKLQKEADVVAMQLKATKDKLDRLKRAGKPPAKPADIAADIERTLAELKAQLDATQAERQRLESFKRQAEVQAARLEEQLQKLIADTQALEAKRAQLANLPGAAAKSAYLEVTVNDKDAKWPFRVTEYGADGKLVGSLIVETPAILGPLFSRAAKDANGPKEVRILLPRDLPFERLRTVLEACKLADFQKVVLRHTDQTGLTPLGATEKPVKPVETTLPNKAALEEYLNNLKRLNKPSPQP